MKKIYTINWEDEDPLFNFNLIGINFQFINEPELVFGINKNLNLNFKRIEDQSIINQKRTYNFSVFQYIKPHSEQILELFSNYSHPQFIKIEEPSLFSSMLDQQVLLSSYSEYNYFLKSNSLLDEEFYVNLQELKNIRKIEKISNNTININDLENLILSV